MELTPVLTFACERSTSWFISPSVRYLISVVPYQPRNQCRPIPVGRSRYHASFRPIQPSPVSTSTFLTSYFLDTTSKVLPSNPTLDWTTTTSLTFNYERGNPKIQTIPMSMPTPTSMPRQSSPARLIRSDKKNHLCRAQYQ